MRRSLHVLVVIDGLGFGGAEMLLADFARAAALADVEVSVAYLHEKYGSPAAARLREVGIEPVGLGVGGIASLWSLRSVYRHVGEIRPDVVHTHLGYSDFLGGLAAAANGVPVVNTIHLTRWRDTTAERVRLTLSDLARRLTSSRVVTVSDAARSAYLGAGWGPRDRVVTIHNCIRDGASPGTGRRIRQELGIAPDEYVVGMISVLRRGKGHAVASEAIATVRAQRPRTRLVVVGDGPSRDDVAAALATLGEAAVMTGHREDVMEMLDAFDVFLLPSEHEAFPTALLEAMAAGLPIIASGVGGVPEIIEDRSTGLVLASPVSAADLAGRLVELHDSHELRAELGRAARARFAQEFSLDHWGERLRALYEDAICEDARLLQTIARWVPTRARTAERPRQRA